MKENNEPHTAEGAVFDRQCASCLKVLDCQGKPKEVKDCINYKGRGDKGGKRSQMDKT